MMSSPFFRHSITLAIAACFGLLIVIAGNQSIRWSVAIIIGVFLSLLGTLFVRHLPSILYACFVLFLPLDVGKSFFYKPYAGGGHELRINLPEIFLGLLLLLCLLRLSKVSSTSGIQGLLLVSPSAYILMEVCSLSSAADVPLGVFQIVRHIIAFTIFLYVVYYVDTEARLNYTILLLVLGSLPQFAAAVYQLIFQKNIGLYFFGEMQLGAEILVDTPFFRIGGLLGHPNAFATYLLLTLPLALILLAQSRTLIARVSVVGYMMLGTILLVAAQSRASWLGFAAAGIGGLLLFLCHAPKFHVRRAWAVVILIVGVTFTASLSYDLAVSRLLSDDHGSAMSRIPMMIDSINVIRQHPFLGIGINNYARVIQKYDVTGIHREWVDVPVHNLFLLIAAESGIPSLLAFVIFWALVLRKALSLLRLEGSQNLARGIAFSMSIIGFLLVHMADPNYRFYPPIQRQVWLIAGMIVACHRIGSKSHGRADKQFIA